MTRETLCNRWGPFWVQVFGCKTMPDTGRTTTTSADHTGNLQDVIQLSTWSADSQRIHGTGIFTYIWLIFMDPMGFEEWFNNCIMDAPCAQEFSDLSRHYHRILRRNDFWGCTFPQDGGWWELHVVECWGGSGFPHLLQGAFHAQASCQTNLSLDIIEDSSMFQSCLSLCTPPKMNRDTKNDGLENVSLWVSMLGIHIFSSRFGMYISYIQ